MYVLGLLALQTALTYVCNLQSILIIWLCNHKLQSCCTYNNEIYTHVCDYVRMSFLFVDIGVSFSQTKFTFNERDGVAAPVLTLSKPSPCCFHLYVEVEDITTTSKLCIYICNVCMIDFRYQN